MVGHSCVHSLAVQTAQLLQDCWVLWSHTSRHSSSPEGYQDAKHDTWRAAQWSPWWHRGHGYRTASSQAALPCPWDTGTQPSHWSYTVWYGETWRKKTSELLTVQKEGCLLRTKGMWWQVLVQVDASWLHKVTTTCKHCKPEELCVWGSLQGNEHNIQNSVEQGVQPVWWMNDLPYANDVPVLTQQRSYGRDESFTDMQALSRTISKHSWSSTISWIHLSRTHF